MTKESWKAIAALSSGFGGLGALGWMVVHLDAGRGSISEWSTLAKLAVALALAFGVTIMIRYAFSPLTADDAHFQPASTTDPDILLRSRIAPLVLGIGSLAIIMLALGLFVAYAVVFKENEAIKPRIDSLLSGVFTSVLPIFATWVGTVLAFYFTNESFRQAAQTTREASAGALERLRRIPVNLVMLTRDRIVALQLPANTNLDSALLCDIAQKFESTGANGKRVSRLLILDSAGSFVGVIHRSWWMELVNEGLQRTPPVKMGSDSRETFGSLISAVVPATSAQRTYRDIIQKAVAFVSVDQTLAEAKSKMEAVNGAQGVIVTQTGAASTSVTGWILNTDIGRYSQA